MLYYYSVIRFVTATNWWRLTVLDSVWVTWSTNPNSTSSEEIHTHRAGSTTNTHTYTKGWPWLLSSVQLSPTVRWLLLVWNGDPVGTRLHVLPQQIRQRLHQRPNLTCTSTHQFQYTSM